MNHREVPRLRHRAGGGYHRLVADDNIDSLVGQHVPGPDGYRFAAVERDNGVAVRVRIVDAKGNEVAWAAGFTKHDLLQDARRKTAAHETRRA
jgi:hypothetical protein